MNINKIQNVNFKSQMLDKYTKSTPKQAQSNYRQQMAPVGSFEQFICQLNKPFAIQAPEFNIETKELSNNIQLLIDSNNINEIPVACVNMITDEKIPIAIIEILNKILFENFFAINKKSDSISIVPECHQNLMVCEIESKEAEFMDVFDFFCSKIVNLDISDENFNKVKNELISKKEQEKNKSSTNVMQKFYLSENPSIEDLNKVTLDEIKKAYAKILANSQARISISSRSEFCKENKTKIANILEKTFPKMRTKIISETKRIKQIDKDFKIENKAPSDRSIIDKFYVLECDSSLKNEIQTEVLTKLVNTRIKQNLPPDNDCDIIVTYPLYIKDKYFEIYLDSSNKKISASDLEKYINNTLQSFTYMPITKKELDNAKKHAAKELKMFYEKSNIRALALLENYSEGLISLKNVNNILNSLTAEEMNKMINKEFSKPSCTYKAN